MIKEEVKKRVGRCFSLGVSEGAWSDAAAENYVVEEPRQSSHGDFSTNMAMVVAGRDRKNPREVAARLVEMLAGDRDLFAEVTIAGPGFVNFVINDRVWQERVASIIAGDKEYGKSAEGRGRRALVEFVSANPTGPLSVGHGRQAALGDAIARLLAAIGYTVEREYYYNDAGRQMRVLGESVRARYLEMAGREFVFPEDGYQGDYISDIARGLYEEHGDGLAAADYLPFKEAAEKAIFADIDSTLKRIGIVFDNYYNEHTLYDEGKIDEVVAALRDKGLVYEEEGAVWFKTTELGLDSDRVIIKSSGEPTYRLPDIAYHQEKFRRGYDWMIDIFGSDHIATVPDVLAGVSALGHDPEKVTVVLHQFVTLMRNGKKVKMSTRKATFVTVDELIDEVGVDAARFFFLMRKADSQLEFDLTLAASQSQDNPVYYLQYGHARLCSIMAKAAAEGVELGEISSIAVSRLSETEELAIIKNLLAFPALVTSAARDLEPHRLIFYLLDLAAMFHSYYNKYRIISEDLELSRARLLFAAAIRVVIRNGLSMIGVAAPEKM